MDKKKILVVEDEAHLAEGLKLNLSLKGYDVRVAADGVSALQKWKEWQPELMVLDIMLPELDGLSVLRHIRLEDERLPVLILSARGDSDDKIRAFPAVWMIILQNPLTWRSFYFEWSDC